MPKEITLKKGEILKVKGQTSVILIVENVDGEIYTRTSCNREDDFRNIVIVNNLVKSSAGIGIRTKDLFTHVKKVMAREEFDKIIYRLKASGDIFEPKRGFVQSI